MFNLVKNIDVVELQFVGGVPKSIDCMFEQASVAATFKKSSWNTFLLLLLFGKFVSGHILYSVTVPIR
jgi:hypothetical protein